MSLPKYPEYKDSGVSWLGEVPAHWMVAPVKSLGRLKGGAGFPHLEQGLMGQELDFFKVNSLSGADVRGILQPSENTISRETAEKLGAFIFPKHSIVFAKVGAALMLGRIREIAHAACIDNNMMGLVVSDENDVAFVRYAMNLVRFDLIANPGAVPSLNEGQIGGFYLLKPPKKEQFLISNFLDRETAKIDALIAEQEKLIALLAEKRQATISRAVTRGLDQNVPLKDSGVPWLGKVPAHWEVLPLKRLFADVKAGPFGSALTKDMYQKQGYRVYGQEQVIPADFSIGDYYISAEKYAELKQYAVEPGDVLISCVGTFGKIAVVPDDVEPGVINPRLIRLKVGASVNNEYLAAVLKSSVVFDQFAMVSRGGTMDTINIGTLSSIVLAVPPIAEQPQLLSFIAQETKRLNSLCEKAEQAIALLKERRAALISAAVTGKMDVRGLAA